MIDGFRLADGVGWADFRDSVVVTVDRTLVEFSQSSELLRSLFDRLGADATVGELEPLLPGVDVADLLARLRDVGVVSGGARAVPDGEYASAVHFSVAEGRALRVAVVGDPDVESTLREHAARSGRVVVADDDEPDVTLVASSWPARVARWSAEQWRAGRIHLPLSAHDGRVVLIGPLAAPGHTACFDCLQLRRSGATTWAEAYWRLAHADELRRPWREDELAYAAATALRVAENALVHADDTTIGQVTTWNPRSMTISASYLWSVPRCPTCSPLETYSTSYPWSEATPADRGYWEVSSDSPPRPPRSAADPARPAVPS